MATNIQYRERNEELIEQLAGAVTEEERDQIESELYKVNVPLIHITVLAYQFPFDYDDRFSICTEAFSKALRGFDHTKETAFATYVTTAMRHALTKYHRDQHNPKRWSEHPHTSLDFITSDLIQRELTFHDLIADPDGDYPKKIEQLEVVSQVLQVAQELLSPKQYKCFVNYIKPDGERLSQDEIANELKVSQMHVSRLTRQGIQKLKDHFRDMEGSRS
ncbi:hypothetical protein JMA_27310 [Jeotgalibacillus malaysiensis]|uniref:RNA polymerase sigma-70 region 4 domain-containing protein n=1 Tax=Jeotgalibacillus malaysiensis TaxID=1508404 RepID=A0A0B5ATZ6_9BACL|nr:sigma-70 family RNA polymerase sigma factor [Jeotgalibacillus malaysiensis]AJD92048.1 hypothetical protein JMA_27310 [Jeotgalibacillus malaysiensis]